MNPKNLFLAVGSIYSHHDLPDNLICTGRRHRDELPLFYNAFDVFCFPSMVGSETFGLVVLEAMACGTPVVVPDFDGPPHVVGDAGVIVPAETFSDELSASSLAAMLLAPKAAFAGTCGGYFCPDGYLCCIGAGGDYHCTSDPNNPWQPNCWVVSN